MNNPNDIIRLLGLPEEEIECFDFIQNPDGNSILFIELKKKDERCPYCKSTDYKIKGYYKVHINNSIIKHRNMLIEVRIRRYECKACKHTFKQNFSLYSTKNSISNNVNFLIKEELKNPLTFKQIANNYDVSTNYVINLFDEMPDQPREHLTEVICIDEFHFSGNDYGQKFPCVISNPKKGRILFIRIFF